MERQGHRIKGIEPGSIAEELELEPGDVLLEINGNRIQDVFDYKYYEDSENMVMLVQKADGELWELILTLPEQERMALYLHYYQGYSTGEAARIMGKNPATVRSWLCRARRRLKNLLEEADGDG